MLSTRAADKTAADDNEITGLKASVKKLVEQLKETKIEVTVTKMELTGTKKELASTKEDLAEAEEARFMPQEWAQKFKEY